MKTLRRVAVLGAGTMGSRIAAHFANAGFPVILLDLPSEGDRNALVKAGIDAARKQKPVAFFTPESAALIRPGNFEDDLPAVAECQWIIEAVAENLEIKRALYEKLAAHRRPGTVLSTNTSGIPLARLAESLNPETRRCFLGTHFFNPPRYLHLCELIPGPETDPDLLAAVASFLDIQLGKGVVPCKDTPNFIANRLGSFLGGTTQWLTADEGLSFEEVDALTGPLIGFPKSASYRLMDIVGLDIWKHVGANLHEMAPEDPWRDRFLMPDFVNDMIARGWIGEKRGQGFYKREGKEILVLDRGTMEYRPQAKPRWPGVEMAREIPDLSERLRTLVAGKDRPAEFLWKMFRDYLLYAASLTPEISDRIVEMDRAMRWGYAHTFGPFELWDALGVRAVAERAASEGQAVPETVQRMLQSGARSFYDWSVSGWRYFDLAAGSGYCELEPRPGVLALPDVKRARGVVRSNSAASLVDLGDGVLCLEFHSKMNVVGTDTMEIAEGALAEAERGFAALVVANSGEHFSAGVNLALVLLAAQEGEWDELDAAVRRFQNLNMALKYAARPVVAAPFGMALGGGCEIALHAARVVASAELYAGLVETGAGLVPAGGGCKEMVLRGVDLKQAFETIGMAKVSSSAAEARALGFLGSTDAVTMNPERLLEDARQAALALAPRHSPGQPRTDISVAGESGYALLKTGVYLAHEAGYISAHDAVIGEKLAYVLAGGRLTTGQKVSEQYLLDLEREAFLSLCGQPKTQERMAHLLKTGKPLRN
ncbi:MAG: 3-hydroxyacyl-CoA dehydrogenase/enoyl-CoA hydratase family protein [Bryobacterales bacterium]|nr:3-hydroxyacyl-CoA dehydrogenase/enoyl-CoA hydratase family protein [Bryobacterales bacterium]